MDPSKVTRPGFKSIQAGSSIQALNISLPSVDKELFLKRNLCEPPCLTSRVRKGHWGQPTEAGGPGRHPLAAHTPRPHVPSHRALVEEARKRRLLEDSDSEEDAAATLPQPASRPGPTAILDEVSGAP